jgi:DNA-binding NarL/FixJ family response regulator
MVELFIMSASAARQRQLAQCVSNEPDIHFAGTAPTFPFLRSLMSESSADILLIDLPPEMQPADIREWLLEFLELARMLVLIPEPDPAIFNLVRRLAPAGLLQANARASQIVQAIRSIASGLTVFDNVLEPRGGDEEQPGEQLTTRETEVLRLLADGLGNRDIAAKLGISEHTIKFHIRSILGKLGATSRTDAVSRGLRSGLIEL